MTSMCGSIASFRFCRVELVEPFGAARVSAAAIMPLLIVKAPGDQIADLGAIRRDPWSRLWDGIHRGLATIAGHVPRLGWPQGGLLQGYRRGAATGGGSGLDAFPSIEVRPPSYHPVPWATGRNRRQRFRLV